MDIEVVIVDDGSSDNTFQIANDLASQDCQIRVFQQPDGQNHGAASARNIGIEQSGGDLICFLDADDTVFPNRFLSPLEVLTESPGVDAVYSQCQVLVEDASQHSEWKDGQMFGISEPLRGAELLRSLIHGMPWSMSAVLVRRTLLQKTGLFSDKFRTAEDCHLWLRMVAAGNVVPDPSRDPVSLYRRRTGSLFSHDVAHNINYLEVLLDFLKWTERNVHSRSVTSDARKDIGAWLDKAFINCRAAGRRDLVLNLFTRSLVRQPSLGCTLRNINHVVRAFFKHKSTPPKASSGCPA